MISIKINGKKETIPSATTLKGFLSERYGPKLIGIAVALNGSFTTRSEWPTVILQEYDELEVLHAVAGG